VVKEGGVACMIGPVHPTFWLSRYVTTDWVKQQGPAAISGTVLIWLLPTGHSWAVLCFIQHTPYWHTYGHLLLRGVGTVIAASCSLLNLLLLAQQYCIG
jgi:hypothetical protein